MMNDLTADEGALRGTKRPAPDSEGLQHGPKRIKALDPDVVNKIAAGEIIVAPMHALKELIENSVDAGSTSIEVLVKDGGLKLLQITDNGHGIEKDDLAILCERFTTSKLKEFEDLSSIGTYGFRGEALASISHIAHLTVTTKTASSSCAWRAHYRDGKLVPAKPGQNADPKATAGRGGTQITVEDLFYNVPTRRRAFRSSSEEYAKILDVVGRYAVHCSGVAFSCRKHGDSGVSISTAANLTTIDRIRQIHGSAVANELVAFEMHDDKLGFRVSGLATNANYHVKRTVILLFINHRSVESTAIKRAIEQTYSNFLPKGGHPFVYIDLEIEPQRVDVNVHPTKREVNFLNEDEIIDSMCSEIRSKLAQVDSSRTFMTQSLLPGVHVRPIESIPGPTDAPDGIPPKTPAPATAKKSYEHNLVRTDSKVRKITSMLTPAPSAETGTGTLSGPDFDDGLTYETVTDREPLRIALTSVKNLRAAVRANMHHGLTETFASHTYVGLVDERRRIAAIQSGVKLYLVDYGMICTELFYQIGLTDFGNFGVIKLDPPPNLVDLLSIAADDEREAYKAAKGKRSGIKPRDESIAQGGYTEEGGGGEEEEEEGEPTEEEEIFTSAPSKITTHLLRHREMLHEYFSLEITADAKVVSIPLLLKGYMPCMAKLPRFLLRLGPYVDWTSEEGCFGGFLRELARFYAPEQLPPSTVSISDGGGGGGSGTALMQGAAACEGEDFISQRRTQMARMLEHVVFPAVRARLVATTDLLGGGAARGDRGGGGVVEVADLKGLYRVFERC